MTAFNAKKKKPLPVLQWSASSAPSSPPATARPLGGAVGSKVGDLVLQGGSDLLEPQRELLVLGRRVLVQRLDDL